MKKSIRVVPGNRYRKADETELVWVVKNVYTPNGFDTHVRAFPDHDPSDVRLYAASVFGDPVFFEPVHVQVEAEHTSQEGNPLFSKAEHISQEGNPLFSKAEHTSQDGNPLFSKSAALKPAE
ncbi:MAG: hypothetical protein CMM76_11050 [Rhodospirillaceae bacterium]|nr:hypothetical protein [Rhodospirillaceae bacterium]